MHGISNGQPTEFIGPWVKIAERAKEQVLKELLGKDQTVQSRACEQAAILVSLENLLSFPWVNERVESGSSLLHGWYFDISVGQLYSLYAGNGRFRTTRMRDLSTQFYQKRPLNSLICTCIFSDYAATKLGLLSYGTL